MTANLDKVLDLETQLYQQYCEAWKEAYGKLKEQEAEVSKLREMLIGLSGGERMEFGVKLSNVVSKGKTNYRAIVEELNVSPEIIDRHTGMPESSWRVTKY